MSSPTGTKPELKAQLLNARIDLRRACNMKAYHYEQCQQAMAQRMEPLANARNTILPNLVGNQTDTVLADWRSNTQTVYSEFDRSQLESAEIVLADVENTAAARKVMNIRKALVEKEEELKNWASWPDEELVRRFESGDLDFSKFTTKSSEHARNVDKIMNAYKNTQPELYPPTREVIRRVAYEVQGEACNTPLESIHWPRHRNEGGCNSDVTISAETAPCPAHSHPTPGTTVGPGGFMSRRFSPDAETVNNMRTRLPDPCFANIASWLQATPELVIEAALLRPYGNDHY
ncbi:uncharacterized protein PAC_01608 [Phialocephala subalpina]|uniref:Uncharacterized protein n=1 Tax=Phialocephala subalpina TaxID=576137 RepID=A0A1L7WG42_9HELO|nr:uncharacterized protein PAC_01608 [Phialocephala subalpina]